MQKLTVRMLALPLLLSAFALSRAVPVPASRKAETAVHIAGAVENPGEWTAARIEKDLPGEVHEIEYTLKGNKGKAHCISLLALVQAAKPHLDAKVKNHQLAYIILARASDGYTVAFTLGDLLPQYGKRDVWVALDWDGQPLPEADGPVRLIVPSEEKPSRWIHAVRSLTILDGRELVENADKAAKP